MANPNDDGEAFRRQLRAAMVRDELRVIFTGGLAVGFVLAVVGRFLIPGHRLTAAGSYEALTHVWCGVALATAVLAGERWLRLTAAGVLAAAVAVELVMFGLLQHGVHP